MEHTTGSQRKQTSFFDFLKLLIMSLISFDSFSVIGKKGQIGGSSDEFGEEDSGSSNASGNTEQEDAGDEGGGDDEGGDEGGDDDDEGDDDEGGEEEGEEDTDDNLSFGSLAIKELMMSIKAAKDFVMRYVMIVVMFFAYGGIYPTMPIFGVLAVMFTLVKYIMFKFRKF